MKLSQLTALAIATAISIGSAAAPAHAGLLGDVARGAFWTGEKVLRKIHEPCDNRARAERDKMYAISKNNPYGTEAAIKANADRRLSEQLRACRR